MEKDYLSSGTVLQGGRYKIVRFISSGGFGCTYEAIHTQFDSRVALKEFFIADFCNRDEKTGSISLATNSKAALLSKLKKKFIDEARAIFKMHHQNIVRVIDVFEENGTAYYAMDYIDGKSLHDIVKTQGKLPEKRAMKYVRQVADALRYVHSLNRLHLDIKPGNIMVDANDNAVVIDFGASKQYDEVNGENTSTLMGKTPGYAPPEQMGNDVVKFTPATDIYALGATIYKILTGITPPSVTMLIGGDELAPLPPGISQGVVRAVAASMQVNRKKRPQSIDEFLNILDGTVAAGTYPTDDATEILDVKVVYDPTKDKVEETREYPIEEDPLIDDDDKQKKGKHSKAYSIISTIITICIIFGIRMCRMINRDSRNYDYEEDDVEWVEDSVEAVDDYYDEYDTVAVDVDDEDYDW